LSFGSQEFLGEFGQQDPLSTFTIDDWQQTVGEGTVSIALNNSIAGQPLTSQQKKTIDTWADDMGVDRDYLIQLIGLAYQNQLQ
jgi:hypothetical protein